jgi:hypothetical protein
VLVDGYTGETTTLSLEVTEDHEISWSPDGQSLLVLSPEETDSSEDFYCLNLYNVAAEQWHYEEPVACKVKDAFFALDDAQQIFYTTDDEAREHDQILWQYHRQDDSRKMLYRTANHTKEVHPGRSIDDFEWSPDGTYLTFTHQAHMQGAPDNTFVILNPINTIYKMLRAPNTFHASYDPVWSPDETHFLITLKNEYIVSTYYHETNHQGDVYLMEVATGEYQRLTYTPAIAEIDLHWIDSNRFMYAVQQKNITALTIEEAQTIDPVPPEDRVQPKPFIPDRRDEFTSLRVSPVDDYSAWIEYSGSRGTQLLIGEVYPEATFTVAGDIYFSTPIPDNYDNVLIGWRPQPEQSQPESE